MRAMDIKERVGRIIQQKRETLEKEIELYRKKLNETESYWGCGGAYSRQQAAIEKREMQMEELDDFEMQLKKAEKHQEVLMYVFGCSNCKSITLVNRQPFSDWHECPVCRHMINLPNLKSKKIRIADSGEDWMQQLKQMAEEG